MGTVLRLRPHEALLGWAAGHTLRMGNLYEAMGSLEGASFVRQHTSGRILMVDQVQPEGDPAQAHAICRMLLNELLARSLEADHTYALCRCPDAQSPLGYALAQLGFLPVPGAGGRVLRGYALPRWCCSRTCSSISRSPTGTATA